MAAAATLVEFPEAKRESALAKGLETRTVRMNRRKRTQTKPHSMFINWSKRQAAPSGISQNRYSRQLHLVHCLPISYMYTGMGRVITRESIALYLVSAAGLPSLSRLTM